MKQKLGLALYAGGNHIFYNIGVLKYFHEKGFRFDTLATYSAGGAVLPCLISKDFDIAITKFKKLTIPNKKNFYPENLFSSKDIFPHDLIYKTAINSFLDFEKTKKFHKELRLIVSTIPSNSILAPILGLAAFLFLTIYGITKKVSNSFFIKLFKKLFCVHGEVVDVRSLKSKEDMLRILLGSSTIYPFIKMRPYNKNRYMLDGKMSMLTPIGILGDCTHVISIHAHYTFPTKRNNLTQIFPIKTVSNGPLDYTGTSYIGAFEQGYSEGAIHYKEIKNLPFFVDKPAEKFVLKK